MHNVKVKIALEKAADYQKCTNLLTVHNDSSGSAAAPPHSNISTPASLVHQRYAHNPGAQNQFLLRSYFLDTRSHSLRQVYATLPRLRVTSPLTIPSPSNHSGGGGLGNVIELRMMSPSVEESSAGVGVAQAVFDRLVAYAATQKVAFPTNIPILDELCTQLDINELFVVESYTCVRKIFQVFGVLVELDRFTIKNHDNYQLQFLMPADKETTNDILALLEEGGVNFSVTTIPKWGRLLEDERAAAEPIFCSCPEAPGGVCVNTPRPSALLASISKSIHAHLVNHIPNHSVVKALSPPPHSTNFMEELPSNSMGTHLLSGPLVPPQTFDSILVEEYPTSVFDMEDLDLHFTIPETKDPLAMDHYLPDAKLFSVVESPFTFGNHSVPTVNIFSSPPAAGLPAQKPTPRAVKKKKPEVKAEFSPATSRGTTPDNTTSVMSSPAPMSSPTLAPSSISKSTVPEKPSTEILDPVALQKKRSCEASARYRRKKQKEEDETKNQVMALTTENQRLNKKIEELQGLLRTLETDNVVLKAKLEVYEQKRAA